MRLIIIIPCLNEEKTIGSLLNNIPSNINGINEIIKLVVDDGSSDKTVEIAKQHGAIILSHRKNMGVGQAFKSGTQKAIELNADIAVNIDGDGQFKPEDIPVLIEPIIQGKADFVTASRFIDVELYPKMSKIKFIGNKLMARFISYLTNEKFYDVSCGFRAYSKEALLKLNLFGKFTYTQETFIDMIFKGLTIQEIPIKVRGRREFGKSRIASNLFKYALNTFNIILKSYRDYMPFKFFSFIGHISLMPGLLLGIFLLLHYIKTGLFTPYKWTGFASAFLILTSLIFYLLGFVLDMFMRMRQNQEQLLHLMKKNAVNNKK